MSHVNDFFRLVLLAKGKINNWTLNRPIHKFIKEFTKKSLACLYHLSHVIKLGFTCNGTNGLCINTMLSDVSCQMASLRLTERKHSQKILIVWYFTKQLVLIEKHKQTAKVGRSMVLDKRKLKRHNSQMKGIILDLSLKAEQNVFKSNFKGI